MELSILKAGIKELALALEDKETVAVYSQNNTIHAVALGGQNTELLITKSTWCIWMDTTRPQSVKWLAAIQ